jgi:H+/Cl- antiporter ClcA
MLCGLIISLLALSSHSFIYGTGYAQVKSLLDNQDNPSLIFGPLKFLSTLISGLSGIPGGIFAPSLSIGAGMGADLYQLFHSSSLTTMTLLGMVGFFSGVVQSPLTAFVIVLEMSDDHQIIIPLMIASILAYGVSRLISEKSLYHTLAQRFIKQYKMKTSVFNA